MKTKQNESLIHNGKYFLRIHMRMEMLYTFTDVNSFCYYFWKDDATFLYRFLNYYMGFDKLLFISNSEN